MAYFCENSNGAPDSIKAENLLTSEVFSSMTLVTLVNSRHIFCRHFYTQLDKNVSCTQPAGLSKGKNRSNLGTTEAALGRDVEATQKRTFSYCLTFFFPQISYTKLEEDCERRHSRYYRAYV
jgi:hypothetical protein